MCYRDTIRLCLGYDEEEQAQTTRSTSFGQISTCFFFLFVFFLYSNHIYEFHRYYGVTEGLAGGYDGEIGPKRRETRRLGHSVSIF